MKRFIKVLGLASVVGITAANAALTAPTIDTTNYETIAGAILIALGVFFGIKKALRLLG